LRGGDMENKKIIDDLTRRSAQQKSLSITSKKLYSEVKEDLERFSNEILQSKRGLYDF
jgi:hypothetical protein